ncbi:hypothetical protein HMPREF1548_04008 [Clostridium sp. KLE 1755]|nr:hypothetical protein HMPREF1548_04008 [Clostridium sp. KLE 1755]
MRRNNNGIFRHTFIKTFYDYMSFSYCPTIWQAQKNAPAC